ncbi:MAG: hypothetical protein GXC72_02615 [Chitinophagaceae bacterium]|jgi:hypothetical protein|nr:hypothetical protein [Chitinophagaceae bacterium]
MVKRIVNIFLILVMAIQTLPIKEMGRMLFANQFTEEIPHTIDGAPDSKQTPVKSDFLSTAAPTLSLDVTTLPFTHPVTSDAIPQNHTGDILVPPPNC